MNKLIETLRRFSAWKRRRKVRKAVRAADKTVNTAASTVGTVLRLALKAVATVLLILITTGLLFACIFAVYVKTCLTDDLDISLEEAQLCQSSTIWYEDTDGSWQEMTTLEADENRVWVDYDQIPIYMEQAAVSIEDQRFYTHKGVDWYRTVAAFANMFVSMQDNFGGSTITQQLIKNLTEYDDVTVQRKLLEIFRALELEKTYTKSEIMTWYLNEIYLGEGCYGVGTAAQMYFGKDVSQLDLAECACIIGITNNPSLYDPYASDDARTRNKTRQETILHEMYEQGYITYDQYVAAKNEELVFKQGDMGDHDTTVYSYYADTVIRDVIADLAEARGISELQAERLVYNSGYNIYSCVDIAIQNVVDNYYENLSNFPSPYRTNTSQQLESGIVIIDPSTGDIVALCGGTGEKEYSLSTNRATISTRPPGSSIKPLSVYSPAIDTGLVTSSTIVNDSPGLTLNGTSWYPNNSGNSYAGEITVRQALVNSKNTIAAQLLDRLGLATSWNYVTEKFGIDTLVRDAVTADGNTVTDYAYAPLALGQFSYGVTVRAMAQAYTAFPNDGVMSKSRTYSLVTDSDGNVVLENPTTQTVAIKQNTARVMCSMMQDAVKYGTGTDAYFDTTAVAGKTGTTSDDMDRYFVGFSMYYVAAVWTGYDTPTQMYFSQNPAAVVWHDIMSQIHANLEYRDFNQPEEEDDSGTETFVENPTYSYEDYSYYYDAPEDTEETDDTELEADDMTDDTENALYNGTEETLVQDTPAPVDVPADTTQQDQTVTEPVEEPVQETVTESTAPPAPEA